jgi:murein DD-endopeptidase MepM/ murein hydrolase activator NlpD
MPQNLLTRFKCWMLLATMLAVETALAQPLDRAIRTAIPAMSTSLQLKAGVVEGNVFVSLSQAGVPDEVALTMVRELSQAINLETAVKAGDRFALLYEKSPFGSTAKSKLLAFEYTHDVMVYALYLFENGSKSGFYQEDGVSLRRAYLRTPVEIVKVSSGFGSRKHPIHKTWLTHEGTDFAAPTGTRVLAAGDGEVAFIGTQNGFGKVIKLKHPQDTQTVYAHLSAFTPTLKVGDTVKQADEIGLVGATGWATGPHLHYEYRVGNKPIDPFSASLPISNRIPPESADLFVTQLTQLRAHFALVRKPEPAALTNINQAE